MEYLIEVKKIGERRGLNPRMVESQSTALPLGYARPIYNRVQFFLLERIAGIEPAPSAWKAEALPLCNIRFFYFNNN